jgi:hypothetical protein
MKILYTNVISVEAYLRDQDDYKITSMIFTKKKSNPYTVFAPLQLPKQNHNVNVVPYHLFTIKRIAPAHKERIAIQH